MVHIVFYNLLRSTYRITEEQVEPGTIHDIINELLDRHPIIKRSDLESAVVFLQNKPLHFNQFHTTIPDHARIIFTHFVGGG